MYKILVWGTGSGYNSCIGILKYWEGINEIEIIGITSNDNYYDSLDGIKFYRKNELDCVDYDYIIVTAKKVFSEICDEGIILGIGKDKFISSNILYIPGFSFKKYIRLLKSRISIISDDCWGGITYHYLNMKFLSPFINMYIEDDEYLRLVHNLKEYLMEPLVYCNKEINPVEKFEYPVFKLGDVKLHMNHYHTIEEGERFWYERLKRINWDNVFVMMYTESKDVAKEFSKIPYEKKVCFVGSDDIVYPSVMPIKPYQSRNDKEKMLWEYILAIAGGRIAYYDVWSLLLDGKIKYRAE